MQCTYLTAEIPTLTWQGSFLKLLRCLIQEASEDDVLFTKHDVLTTNTLFEIQFTNL